MEVTANMVDIFEKCSGFTAARQLIEAGIYPYFKQMESVQAPEVKVGGKMMIMMGSNNYLGLADDPRMKKAAEDALEQFEFHRYIQLLQSAIDLANRHIQNTAPWKMAKENNPALPTVLFNLAAHLRIIALYLYPFMPKTAAGIWQQLGAPEPLETAATGFFCAGTEKDSLVLPAAGTATSKGGIMFPRIK